MKNYVLSVAFFLILFQNVSIISSKINSVNDNELIELIQNERYLVTLFTRRNSDASDDFEKLIETMKEPLTENLEAEVVIARDSQMTRLYSPTKEPVLVFFRHGIPLLYDGPQNEDLILHIFTQNLEPAVKELTDETFEHLTQAASGATTGDWLVMFYMNDCVDCQRLQARWEAVGAQLKNKVNVAQVNRGTTGSETAKRFSVTHVPAFLLFRQGKFYRYEIRKLDVSSFVAFATDWYKHSPAERVPLPATPFDNITAALALYLKDNPWLLLAAMFSFVIGLMISLMLKYRNSQAAKTTDKSKKK